MAEHKMFYNIRFFESGKFSEIVFTKRVVFVKNKIKKTRV